MATFMETIDSIFGLVPLVRTIIIALILLILFTYILKFIKKSLLKKAKTKKQISNIEIFTRILYYILVIVIVIVAIFSYFGAWSGFGIWIGLISAALGWALQRPITGIAGWLMVVMRRPFNIGDRIILAGVKGDVVDLTLTHVYIKEIGGIVGGEESSGRIIMIPNSFLFEQNIINYTFQNEFVLDQVTFFVTHDSNIKEIEKIAKNAARKYIGKFLKIVKKEPYIRTWFQPNGVNVHVRFWSPAQNLEHYSSSITQEIWQEVNKSRKVSFAYPHTQILFRGKK